MVGANDTNVPAVLSVLGALGYEQGIEMYILCFASSESE